VVVAPLLVREAAGEAKMLARTSAGTMEALVDATAGMKLCDVAALVCFLRRVSGIEGGGGSRKVQGC